MDVPQGELSPNDLDKIAHQIGRKPRGVVAVVKRCKAHHPQVIATYPLRWGSGMPQIFPTLYWLTCPALVRTVGDFETDGWVGRFQQQMLSNDNLRQDWEAAHADYAKARMALVPEKVLVELRERFPGQSEVLETAGVGGIRGEGIKCLHTNLAHTLTGAHNPIGELVLGLLAAQGKIPDYCYDDALECFCSLGHSAEGGS
ncbi:MAG: DUF501 domain-containing protein [Firmicutes bacterium]|nr:DUF501 domain-containing protein [Bacillota bacterium]